MKLTIRDLLAFVLFALLLFPTCLARRLSPWLWPAFAGTLDEVAGVRKMSAKCQDATANRAANVMYEALGRIGDEAAAAIATKSVLDDKQALAGILRVCQEALR